MSNLIIINGAPGIGKSTIGNILLSRLNNSALLDGDDLWRINPHKVTDITRNLVEKNISCVLQNYIKAEYEYVILVWVLHRQEIIDRILSGLEGLEFGIRIFTLVCSEDDLLERLEKEPEKGRNSGLALERLRQSMLLETEKMDTSVMMPDEIVGKILEVVSG